MLENLFETIRGASRECLAALQDTATIRAHLFGDTDPDCVSEWEVSVQHRYIDLDFGGLLRPVFCPSQQDAQQSSAHQSLFIAVGTLE